MCALFILFTVHTQLARHVTAMSTFEHHYVGCKQERDIKDQCYNVFDVTPAHAQNELYNGLYGNSMMFKENNIYSLVTSNGLRGLNGHLPSLTTKNVSSRRVL